MYKATVTVTSQITYTHYEPGDRVTLVKYAPKSPPHLNGPVYGVVYTVAFCTPPQDFWGASVNLLEIPEESWNVERFILVQEEHL